ncbi:MAG: IclR family transcriptional regulator [Actinomycetota bacterium]|nr:IclR family transcriptional regulator [Actinomycetota bacterium]
MAEPGPTRPDASPGLPAARLVPESGRTSALSSVTNAARLLKEFGHGRGELGVSELARRLRLSKSSVHRLLITLTAERLIEQDSETGAYRLGLLMYDLGVSVALHSEIHAAALPILEQLRALTKESVQVAVLDGREVVYVDRLESPHSLRTFGRIGHRISAHCTSTGKVLLAYLPEDVRATLLTGWKLTPMTPYTITDPKAFRDELARVRLRGVAENVNEGEVGVASIGAPIRDARDRVIAAVSVVAPIVRLEGQSLRHLEPQIIQAAAAISHRLGWRAEAGAAVRVKGA